MKPKNLINIIISTIFVGLLFTTDSCEKGCTGDTIKISASPNPVTAVYTGDIAKWTIKITFTNNTCQGIILGNYTIKVYDTDTGFTDQNVYSNSAGNGYNDGQSGVYTFEPYGNTFHTGKYEVTMTATGLDGQEYEASVTVILQ